MYKLYVKIYDENPPKHIRVYGEDWYWNDYDGYVTKESLKTTPDAQIYLMDRYRTFMNLDKEVEIIEEPKGIPEKLNKQHFHNRQRQLANKINKIIDYLDYLKRKGE